MDTVDDNENTCVKSILSGDDLFKLRKSCDIFSETIEKKFYFSDGLNSSIIESLLQNKKKAIDIKGVTRIGNFIQAEWQPNSQKSIITKLKGKTQHMGTNLDGKIALSPEETIFLLEHGNLELCVNGIPLSTESAYSMVFNEDMSIEKYRVYAYLSHLGFIVINHQNDLDVTQFVKLHSQKKCQCKRKENLKSTSLSKKIHLEQQSSSSFSLYNPKTVCLDAIDKDNLEISCEKNVNTVQLSVEIKNSLICNQINMSKSDINELSDRNTSNSLDSSTNLNSAKLNNIDNDDDALNCDNYSVESTSANSREFIFPSERGSETQKTNNEFTFNKMDLSVCSKQSLTSEIVENDKIEEENLTSTDNIKDFNTGKEFTSNTCVILDDESSDLTTHFESSVAATLKSDNEESSDSEVLYLYNSSNELESDEENTTCDINNDSAQSVPNNDVTGTEDVVVLEVDRMEIKPLAVIDLSSDDEDNFHDSPIKDDDVQIINECRSSKPPRTQQHWFTTPVLNSKLKCKISSLKVEQNSTLNWPFPNLFRKRVICLPRPPANLLPFNVYLNKEAYTLDLNLLTAPNNHIQTPRVWNSYKDLEIMQKQKEQTCQKNFETPMAAKNLGPFPSPCFSPCTSPFQNNIRPVQQHHSPSFEIPSHINNDNLLQNCHPFTNRHVQNSCFPYGPSQNFQPFSNRHSHEFRSFSYEQAQSSQSFSHPINSNHSSFQSSVFCQNTFNSAEDSKGNLFALGPMQRRNQWMNNVHVERFQQSCDPWNMSFNENLQSPSNPWAVNPFFHNQSQYFLSEPELSNRNFPNLRTQPFEENSTVGRITQSSWKPLLGNAYPSYIPKNLATPCVVSWRDLKTSNSPASESFSAKENFDDVQEVSVDIDEVLWSKEIKPLLKPSPNLLLSNALKALQKTSISLLPKVPLKDRSFPDSCSLQISFDVYLPGTIYRKTCPAIPDCRIVVKRSSDPFPKLSEIYSLLRKYNDSAVLQFAVVDNGNIAFYSFNNVTLPDLLPL